MAEELDGLEFEFMGGPMDGSWARTGAQQKVRIAQCVMQNEDGITKRLGCTYIYERRGDKYYHVTTLHVGAGS